MKRPVSDLVTVHTMAIDDLGFVWRLGKASFTSEISYSKRLWTEDELLARFVDNQDLCLVASFNDRIVGFVLGGVLRRTGSSWSTGYFLWIAVAKRYQKKGVALKLYRELEHRLRERGARNVICEVETRNFKALDFMRRVGFREDHTVSYLKKSI
ncbi:MAG TPA: GNAT family N-acetyltransferase [Conexivisphaerales archaeon]|nr:GNAT family N-acetyltransferase [Conexivisphaerales archaeon]